MKDQVNSGLPPVLTDVDIVDIHDATSAEEHYCLESLGFFGTGGGCTGLGGHLVVNPSDALVAGA